MQKSNDDVGFTLIEILIVLVIMAVLAGAVSVSVVGADRTIKLKDLAENISLVIPLGQEQAILQPTQIGMVFSDHDYSFYKYVPSDSDPTQGDWQPIHGEPGFDSKTFSTSFKLKITTPENQTEVIATHDTLIRPQIIMYSSGDITAFKMTLSIGSSPPLFLITGSSDGNITLERLGEKNNTAPTTAPAEEGQHAK